jgi:hypothetical protein
VPRRPDGRSLITTSVRQPGGHQIDYDLEDPYIKQMFAEALATK